MIIVTLLIMFISAVLFSALTPDNRTQEQKAKDHHRWMTRAGGNSPGM